MVQKKYTKEIVLKMTKEVVHSFFDRKKDEFLQSLSEDLMWIGAFDFQWAENLSKFVTLTSGEFQSPQIFILEEEYHLLKKTNNLWIIYGKYKNCALLPDGTDLHAHNRGTFIWEKKENELKLIHIHSSSAYNVPLSTHYEAKQAKERAEDLEEGKDFLGFLQKIAQSKPQQKLLFRDLDGSHHIFHPFEILYLKANGKYTEIHARNKVILAMGMLGNNITELPFQFVATQKSFVVNRFYIETIERYQAKLKNGESIPISKHRYMEVREQLDAKN